MNKNEKLDSLIKLMKENPELPVIPMVDSQIVCDEDGWWIGNWANAGIEEYIQGKERFWLKEEFDSPDYQDIWDVLADCVPLNEYFAIIDSQALVEYNKLDWKKAIVVYITMP